MLVLTVGVLYWAAERGNDTESAQAVALLSQAGSALPVSVTPGAILRRPVTFPLDLNPARAVHFMDVPGTRATLAQRLVEHPRTHNGLRSVDARRTERRTG